MVYVVHDHAVVPNVQFHKDQELTANISSVLGLSPTDYDGAADFFTYSLDDLLAVFTDAEFIAKVNADEKNFDTSDGAIAFIGYDEVQLDTLAATA